jgi:hypothetical protein
VANYGDAALNLGPEWARYKENDQNYALQIVGHDGGESDVYLKTDPDKKHQFAWVDTKYSEDVQINQSKRYRFVKKDDGWVKRDGLWDWDAEGFLVFRTLRLMARDESELAAEMGKRKAQRDRVMGGETKEDQEIERLEARAEGKPKRKGLRNN